ncbi:site-specific integrase [Saccharopolyspora taberi]|uniref:Site-specific integrase n=1 Tax=Saccharopolyspora taberi TaxID=60895 RepID=A0ABN3V168_9PSEU
MARPPLPLGTWGAIRTYGRIDGQWTPKESIPEGARADSWRAVTNYRGHDGNTRQVERSGSSETKARRSLREALGKQAGQQATLGAGSRFADAAKLYLEQIQTRRSGTTYDRYKGRLNKHVLPAIGQLLLRECTVSRLEKFMTDLERKKVAANTRRGIRTVLSGVMQYVVLNDETGIISRNPVRDLSNIEGAANKPVAMTADQLSDFLAKLDADETAAKADLPDFIRFVFGTGVRFGEALAVRWRDLNLTDESITVYDGTGAQEVLPPKSVWINGNIVAVSGKGLVRHEGKTFRAKRVIGMPDYLFTLLLVRKPFEAYENEPVFPSGTLGWRHPSNMQRSVRRMRERIEYPGFKTHIGRKTVATILDMSGQTAREIADQLGHANPSMTQNVYMGRGMQNPGAAAALDAAYK